MMSDSPFVGVRMMGPDGQATREESELGTGGIQSLFWCSDFYMRY